MSGKCIVASVDELSRRLAVARGDEPADLVIRRGRCLQKALQFRTLPLLPLDLILQQRYLPGQLAIGVMGLIGFGFGIANTALDHCLVDRIGLGGFLSHQAHPDE